MLLIFYLTAAASAASAASAGAAGAAAAVTSLTASGYIGDGQGNSTSINLINPNN